MRVIEIGHYCGGSMYLATSGSKGWFLFSGMLGAAMVCKENWFDGSLLKIKLSSQV